MQQAHNGRANECSLSLTGTSGFGEPARTKGALQRSTGGWGGGCLWKCFRHPPLKEGGGVGLETSVFWCCVENWKHRKTCISLKTYFILFHTFNSKQRARLQQPQRRVDPILPAFVRWAEINQDCHQKAETCTEGWEAGMFAADQSLHNKDPCANTPVIRSWCLTLSAPSPTALSFHGVSCLFSQDVWPLVERLKFNLLRKDPKHERGRLAGLKLSILGGITGTGEWFVGKTVYLWADLSWSVHKHKQWEAVIPSQTLLR